MCVDIEFCIVRVKSRERRPITFALRCGYSGARVFGGKPRGLAGELERLGFLGLCCLLRGRTGRDGRGGEFPAAAVRRQERAGRESAEDVPRLPGGVSQHSLLPLSLGGGCMLCVCER